MVERMLSENLRKTLAVNEKECDEGMRDLIMYKYGLCSGFTNALFKCISRADSENLKLLARAYPLHVEAYKEYNGTNAWVEAKKDYCLP
jgi:hypothetical protein